MSDNNTFLGRGWAFPPAFDAQHQGAELVDADEDIKQSLTILFSTHPGERVMNPAYGCPLKLRVFDEINLGTLTEIKSMIKKAVLLFEPRITLEQVKVNTEHSIDGRLLIELEYLVITTNTRSNMVYPFYLREGTLVDL